MKKFSVKKLGFNWMSVVKVCLLALLVIFLLSPYISLVDLDQIKYKLIHDFMAFLIKIHEYMFANVWVLVALVIVAVFGYLKILKKI